MTVIAKIHYPKKLAPEQPLCLFETVADLTDDSSAVNCISCLRRLLPSLEGEEALAVAKQLEEAVVVRKLRLARRLR